MGRGPPVLSAQDHHRGDATGIRTLRQGGGLSGFTKRSESEYDPFGAGAFLHLRSARRWVLPLPTSCRTAPGAGSP